MSRSKTAPTGNRMSSLEPFKATYFQECEELLVSLEAHLRELGAAPSSREPLDAAFRAIHSIKGGAAMFQFARMVALADALETALDRARSGRVAISRSMAGRLLSATDILSDLAEAARSGSEAPDGHETAALAALAALDRRATRTTKPAQAKRRVGPTTSKRTNVPSCTEPEVARPVAAQPATYRIRFEPGPELLRRGLEPIAIVRNLKALGKLAVSADVSGLPAFAELDTAILYLRWTFHLTTSAPRATVAAVFDFAATSATVEIVELPVSAPTSASASVSAHSPPASPFDPPTQADRRTNDRENVADRRGKGSDRRVGSIRVELPRVERLVDLVGEITIAQAMVLQHLDQTLVTQNPQLFRALTGLLKLSRTLQDSVMAIRAQPIQTIFVRMHRVARDSAEQLGREIELHTSGETTQLDKTTVEQLADPLMHIVRNAIFHGIECPDVRLAAGKPAQGTIRLSARQRGSRIIVEVADDGAGIDREAVLSRAIAMGIVPAGAALDDAAIDNLIFSPGLSTAKTISDIAGRGVGMDVVHQNIRKLGGHIQIRSSCGIGTTTIISLPMTLAVLDAMKLTCGLETYLLPIAHILECMVVRRSAILNVPGSCKVIEVRGKQIQLISLAQRFGLPDPQQSERVAIVLAEIDDGSVIGLVVDEVCGHQQIIVKSLRDPALAAAGFAGGTILGDGNVALILDVNQLVRGAAMAAARTPRSMRVTFNAEFNAA